MVWLCLLPVSILRSPFPQVYTWSVLLVIWLQVHLVDLQLPLNPRSELRKPRPILLQWSKTEITRKLSNFTNVSVIGQIIGDGRTYSFSTSSSGNMTICLDLDPSIPQDTSTYANLDFVTSTGTSLSLPLQVNVTISGTQYCATVPAFQSSTFVPIIRNNAIIISASAGTSTTTKVSGAEKYSIKFAYLCTALALLFV